MTETESQSSLRALVTRPYEDAPGIAGELAARGFKVLIEPMIEIVPRPDVPIELDGIQAILVTSTNGVRALAAATPCRDLRLLAVGDASARLARELGFGAVESAGGDVESLAVLVVQRADPAKGALLHVAGSHVAGDLGAHLGGAGFDLRRVVLYEARAARGLSPALLRVLDEGGLAIATFFSPRTAAAFVTLVQDCGRDKACATITAYGLGRAVTAKLAQIRWHGLRAADRPRLAALLAAIDEDFATGKGQG